MESLGVLESIAEVAISLAGFGGIAAGLGYRARGKWSGDDRARLLLLAAYSLCTVFGCYLPYVTLNLGADAPLRAASAIFLPLPTVGFLFLTWSTRRGLTAAYSRAAAYSVLAGHILVFVLLLAAALGYAAPREFGFYLSAMLVTLIQASLYFLRLLFTSFRERDAAR